mmetsp:Transcript_17270/g.33650  ORF Transcript_17270/g.33650 Transcript_17270/m.33650 type:complete len:4514 (+) Transcript_17270:154-13695(+)|eukprot:CAMPEP_0175136120 /NCGR_PEP_ID=MMETSP0087-20121206/9098_1 /TAXON_ID=136419 /ORGANISM="Unknown Unknown, Strain D1" /LENGTH=4513 /DNA_ID=CAMNT_0016418839 /DNA_START=274 /DNA_END=13815 /DNA_ORIENTATION=+
MAETQKLLDWFMERVRTSMQGKNNLEKFLKAYDTEEVKSGVTDFITDDTAKVLVVYQPPGYPFVATVEIPQQIKGKGVYFLKPPSITAALTLADLDESLICNEINGGEQLLDNLSLVAGEVYFPLLSNPANRAGWSGPTSKEIMLSFSTFLSQLTMTVGQLHGTTTLPHPPPEAFDEDNLAEKERVHLLETSVVQWSNKIHEVLKEDPESLATADHYPTPHEEYEFWVAKGKDLDSLCDQLASEKMQSVLEILKRMQSVFGDNMDKLTKSVAAARDEAKENARFLKPMLKYFTSLESELEFTDVTKHFVPMMHTCLLIWQHSTTYDTHPRLICLIQEICNSLVAQAGKTVSGEMIFRFIDDENVSEGRMILKNTIDVCQAFKNAFQRAKVKSQKHLPEGAWDVPEETLFVRLDAFLQRCEDMMDFIVIVVEFAKLEKVCLGGTKGNDLTDDVRSVHEDFTACVHKLQNVPYDLMDITAARFDTDFFQFRCDVKDLERRVSVVVQSAFDDCSSIDLQFKCLEGFEGLLERPIVKENLETQQNDLLKIYMADLVTVQEIFHTHKNDPRVDSNMPPIAGALSWCRSLLDRIRDPIEKVRAFTASCGEELEEMEKTYDGIVVKLEDYEAKKITEWTHEIDSSSQAKLMQSLLQRDKETRHIKVNFDKALIRLLREVKYSLLLKLEVPANALAIYEKATMYRTQIANLELIVQMYNEMMETLHMVERPLVEKEIAHIDETIEKGISELNWKSPEVNEFTKISMDTVKAVYQTVKIMKDNFEKIKKMMTEYAKTPLADRKNKTLSPSEFEENIRKLWETRHKIIAQHQEQVMQLLTETNEALKVNKGSPIWRAYVEYAQDHIRDGLSATIVNSIKFICEQLDINLIEKNQLVPLLEIKLGLYANDVLLTFEDTSASESSDKAPRKSRRDVWQIVNDWVEGFFEIGNIMTRVDGSHYVGDLKKNEGIVRFINALKKHLDQNQKECENYRQEYLKYEFLWKTDRQQEFNKFLSQSSQEEEKESEEGEEAEADGEAKEDKKDKDAEPMFLPLDKFEEKILYYNQLQSEINDKKSVVEIGWLKINAQPIKQALATWASRWTLTFTSYLYNDVTRKLNQMESLMNDVNQGVNQEVVSGDSGTLKAVLGHIHQVRSREKVTPKMFAPLRDSAALLKKYGKPLDEYELKLLADAPMKWDATVNTVYKVKEKVNTLQNDEVDKIKFRVWRFDDELSDFRREFRRKAPFGYEIGVNEAYAKINEYHHKITQKEEEAAILVDLEQVFELTVSKHAEIKKSRAENKMLKQVWDMISIVKHKFEDWKKTLWDDIDTDDLVNQCKKLNVQINAMPKEMRTWKVFVGLQAEVKNLLTVLPLVNLLHSPFMKERHWRDLKTATGKQFNKDKDFRLQNILELHLHKHVADVEAIVELANKESKISTNLEKITLVWEDLNLEFGVHEKKGQKVAMIVSTDEILTNLEENMQQLQGMAGQGKYVEHFIDEVTKWQAALGNTETVLFNWLEVQQKWASLESIYLGSKDIRVQLPEDSRRFDEIDANWKKLMGTVESVPRVLDACSAPGRSDLLQKMNVGLDQCEKSLFMYLETKRMAFPRFYFMANAALLDILSNGHDPQAVQKHLGDCFDNINKLEYDKDESGEGFTKFATGMYSKDGGEYVPWSSKFEATGAVEAWLNGLVRHQQAMMTDILERAKSTADHWDVDKPRHVWVFDFPAQCSLTASQIIWTEEVGSQFDAFADGNEQAMKEYSKTLTSRLEAFINLVLGELTKCDRIKVITLITVDVHNRDVVQRLIDEKIQEATEFAWQCQMRYDYKAQERKCYVRVTDAAFLYAHEYVGNTGRLVITPLTDRCYITLSQALRLIMGGAPAGPAGTGKTETTKDLARALGLPCYVFNCSEQMNVQSMGAIFKGLSQTGAWGCFDEFNRIPIETLSVVATQVSSVLNAIRAGKEEFDFLGEIIKLIPSVGMFITMNPGYAGRTELPENLKALFRSCAMVVPDIELICENMLMSEGFLGARRLAKKFVTLYGLSKELLSKQMHYDWGLRATKAVLRVAGGLKRAEPEVDEDRILMRALRDFNLPKLVDDDKPIFVQLVDDLFPGLGNTVRKFDQTLADAIGKMAVARGLQADEVFVLKTVELFELLEIRHSVFIIGPAGCGKSEIWQTLAKAENHLGRKTVVETLNPKAVRNRELYGWLSKADWYDGVLSTLMRNMSRNVLPYSESQVGKWVILDGDIDPEWIESLNTVMDDNKVLTLVSNERIPLTPAMRMIFEVSNLDNATPATVSRAGIIFVNAKDVGYKPFLDSWIESRDNDKEKSSLLALFNKYVTPENLNELRTAFKRQVPLGEVNTIRCFAYLLEGLLDKMNEQLKKTKVDPVAEKEIFEANFVFAGVWAFGGAMLVDKQMNCRAEFSEWWKRVFPTIKFPKEGTVFDYYPDAQGKMVPWSDVVKPYDPPADAYLVTKVFVPTVDTTSSNFLLDLLVYRRRAVLMVGNAGTGKSVLVQNYLRALPESFTFSAININYYTDAKALQRIMEGSLDKRSGRSYGPPGTKKLIYFIDDLNMSYVDIYNTQTPNALIRQHMDYGSWFDTTALTKKDIQDVQYISCMNPTSGSFTINPRLQGNFCTFATQLPTQQQLAAIYQSVMEHHFSKFGNNIKEMVEKLVLATLDLHDSVASKFLPSSKKFHYQFNLRDLASVFQGLSMSNPKAKLTPNDLVDLWSNETCRVFQDRLISISDCEEFDKLLESKKGKHLKDFIKPAEKKQDKDGNDIVDAQIWATFTHTDLLYTPCRDSLALRGSLQAKLDEYNESNVVMNLELFNMACNHVCRIVRIIENPRGNAMLVGVGGSGKQSLARLSCFICGYDVFQISVSQSYGMSDLKADLQELYMKAGVKNIPMCFLLTDTQIGDDEWLVFINDLLNTGFIPDLFGEEDLDGIFNSIRSEAKAQGVPDNRQAMMDFFLQQVRTNLHMVLAFSPVGAAFRVRCRKFPGLINCCAIDWFHPWPREALVKVCFRFLDDIEFGEQEEFQQTLAEHMAEVHLTVNTTSERYLELERRFNYTTPKSYLEFIEFYKNLLSKKRADLRKQSGRLEKGIDTLRSTASDVAALKEDLTVTLVKVAEKQASVSELIAKMGVERGKVEEQQAFAAVEAQKAKAVADVANKIAGECERDLAAALPVMEQAKDAVNCLSKASLTTLKSFAQPPGNCVFVTNATMILKGFPGKRDWPNAKKMMKDVGKFLDELKEFDATTVTDETIEKLQPILKQDFFNAESMTSSSEAAANLCSWVVNIVAYNRIYINVAPKMASQAKAQGEYEAANAKLKAVEEKVAALQRKLKEVTDSLKAATDEKNKVEAQAASCQSRLALAKRLVDGLADENVRWGKAIDGFKELERTLIGDVILAAAFVSYIGAFNQSFRHQLWNDTWVPDLINRQIPLQEGIDPLTILANDSDFAKWKNEGLAADRISLENGAILTQASRWPLMIDPQLQGIKWIRNRVKNLFAIQIGQKRWLNTIVRAVSNGDTVILEGVGEELDATLNPVLSRNFFVRAGQKVIQIGAEEVDFDSNFQLYIQTKLFNPHYNPETSAQCTLINFIVTEEGLEDQLLALVVNREKPELEEKRTALVRAINDYMVSLTDLENELLERLSNAPEDILSDVELIEGLEKTKQAAMEIEIKVEQAKKQEISINIARNEFRAVAAESSWLYFLLIQLNIIDHMYQYSLDAFTGFFLKAMAKAVPSDVVAERVVNLRESIRLIVFTWVSRGLFEKHKLIFTCQLCFKLMTKGSLSEKFQAKLFEFLIRGPKILGQEKTVDWLPQANWASLQALIKLPGFDRLISDIEASPNRFKEWYTKARPEATPLPLDWRKLDDTSPFSKLCVVRALRQDRMTTAMKTYVENALPNGKNFTECDASKSFLDVLSLSLDDMTTVNPMFFILSPGADPILTLEIMAKKLSYYEGKFHRVALGEGQDVVAMDRLEIGHKNGHWVVLENIHLMPRWCKDLEKKLDEYALEGSHEDFRVFLTAEPAALPIGLLERSIKLTNEPPQGLKQNLKRAFATFDKDEFEFKDAKVKSILFVMCHFHSVIVERIKFGPKGWNRGYPFNTGDLMNSSDILSNYLEGGGDKIPWKDLRYMFGEIMYGGHITDDWDRLLCKTYLEFYIKEELLDEMELFPFSESFPETRFRSPPVLSYDQYFEYMDLELPSESPVAFGLHPNAEIAVKTEDADTLFRYIMELQPRTAAGGGEDAQSPQALVQQLLESIVERIKGIKFSLEDIASAVAEERGPYQNVFLQECDRMNQLINEMLRSLRELELGLSGELQMSPKMEDLQNKLFLDRVPDSWGNLAYPSLRPLAAWLANLIDRATQLQSWTEEPLSIPNVTNIAFMFNPQSFLTAIMQKTAQLNQLELDKLTIMTDVTRKSLEQTESKAREGAYVTGLFVEGARWNWQQGVLDESEPREMFCAMPVIGCKAVLVDKLETNGVYTCPSYKTQQRGPTYVFNATLRSKAPASKWILAGVCCIMEVADL